MKDNLAAKLIGVVLWAAGVCWLVPMMTAMMLVALVVPPDQTEWLSRLYCRGQVAVTGSRWRAVVDPRVDPNAVYMFAQNHVNLLDHVTMYPATAHFKQGIELEEHFRIPIYGWFMKQRGTIGVRRNDRRMFRKMAEDIRAEAARGHSLLVFPEGTRTLDGRVGPFKTGVLKIARDLGIPVVPVAVTGMYDVLRKGSWVLRPGHLVTVHVLAPMPTTHLRDEDLPDFAEAVRQQVAEKVDAWLASRRIS